MKHTYLDIENPTMNSADEARNTIVEFASACGDPAWMILQSFTKISCLRWNPSNPDWFASFASVFNGRIFGADAEVRWIREGSEWRIWRIKEAHAGSKRYQPNLRRYYLWGIYRSSEKRYVEDRIPGVPVDYFTERKPQDDDRAFVEVREYEAIIEGASPDEIEEQLNQPYVAAHRFLRIDAGRDPKGKDDE